MKLGIEVSNNNGIVDWSLIARCGIQRAVVKIAEGRDFHDEYASSNITLARAAGLSVGGYFFGRPSAGTGSQDAQYAWKIAANRSLLDFWALDLEDTEVARFAPLGAYALDALETINELSGLPAVLYTSKGYALDHQLSDYEDLRAYRLWLAAWQEVEPGSFSPFSDWMGWQFTAEGFVPGAAVCSMSVWKD